MLYLMRDINIKSKCSNCLMTYLAQKVYDFDPIND